MQPIMHIIDVSINITNRVDRQRGNWHAAARG